MSLRTDLLNVADTIRSLASPTTIDGDEGLDAWIHTLTIRTRTWTGRPGATGATSEDEDLVITPNPDVELLSAREISGSGGRYREGDVRVGELTPSYDTGGYTSAQLAPRPTDDGVEIIYVIVGPLAGDYALVEARFDNPFEYVLILRRTRQTP